MCDYKGRRREVMAKRSWTELFFLDEATALAAGHRPCFLCRREAAKKFRMAWVAGNGGAAPAAAEMDAILHLERQQRGVKRIHGLKCPVEDLPDGAMVAAGGQAFVVVAGRAFRWSAAGYCCAEPIPIIDGLITPPSTLAALCSGYPPEFHPSIKIQQEQAIR